MTIAFACIMVSTFLHDETVIPPDEKMEVPAPACERCGHTMWLQKWTRRANDQGDFDVRLYRCKSCGHSVELASKSPLMSSEQV